MKTSWNLFIFLVSSYIRHSVSGDDNYEGGLNPTPTRKQLNTYLLNYLFLDYAAPAGQPLPHFSCLVSHLKFRPGPSEPRGQDGNRSI